MDATRQPPNSDPATGMDSRFGELVEAHYQALYRFAYTLTRREADAADLTQQTFYLWAAKGAQLRDFSRVKAWLFRTLHREFLQARRRVVRFPLLELEETEPELPSVAPSAGEQLDAKAVLRALGELDETFQAPLSLFYLGDFAYQEIAEILGVPIGTVKSRLARGIAQLHQRLATPAGRSVSQPRV